MIKQIMACDCCGKQIGDLFDADTSAYFSNCTEPTSWLYSGEEYDGPYKIYELICTYCWMDIIEVCSYQCFVKMAPLHEFFFVSVANYPSERPYFDDEGLYSMEGFESTDEGLFGECSNWGCEYDEGGE